MMTIKEFEKRAELNNGYDREMDNWKIIDIHIIPEILIEGSEFDFYCSDGKWVYLLRIRSCKEKQPEQLSIIDDKYNDITYFIAEVHIDHIDNELIRSLLDKFMLKCKQHYTDQ